MILNKSKPFSIILFSLWLPTLKKTQVFSSIHNVAIAALAAIGGTLGVGNRQLACCLLPVAF
ncbi:MAG: hypothetical protein AB4426_10370 [Xenococcaceae cyanobacterium]